MHLKYRWAAAAAWVFILLANPAIAKDKHPQNPHHAQIASRSPLRERKDHPARRTRLDSDYAMELYSRRALRRARTILQMKLLELREEHLACVKAALEQHLPKDVLWDSTARANDKGPRPSCLDDLRPL